MKNPAAKENASQNIGVRNKFVCGHIILCRFMQMPSPSNNPAQPARPAKAIALLSGGLDSILAIKVIREQGIDVHALHFTSSFCNCDKHGASADGCGAAMHAAKQLGVPMTTIVKGMDYLKVVEHPKFGRGRAMNPCIDCRVYTLRRAKQFMEQQGASFIFSGEVLGQRPMSQRREAMNTVEREAGVQGILLRPLSAKLLPPTLPEKEGLVDREKLFAISGRGRSEQMKMADDYGLDYPCPSGGCMLTEQGFAAKLRDLFEFNSAYEMRDVELLKVGRHFRFSPQTKIIIGRNEQDNALLKALADAKKGELYLEPEFPAPSALLCGEQSDGAVEAAAGLIAFHGKADGAVNVSDGRIIAAVALSDEEVDKMRINW